MKNVWVDFKRAVQSYYRNRSFLQEESMEMKGLKDSFTKYDVWLKKRCAPNYWLKRSHGQNSKMPAEFKGNRKKEKNSLELNILRSLMPSLMPFGKQVISHSLLSISRSAQTVAYHCGRKSFLLDPTMKDSWLDGNRLAVVHARRKPVY